MTLTFAGELTKMIDAGLGRESAAPDTGVAVGRYSEYIEVSDAALATFDTNAALPLRSLTVNIEPIQAGTGDPSPENVRPITGRQSVTVTRAGKNLFPSSEYWDTGTISPLTGEDLNDIAYWRTNIMTPVNGGVTYTISFKGTVSDVSEFRWFQYGRNGAFLNARSALTITPSSAAYMRFRWLKSYNLEDLQFEPGSSATTYSPYTADTITIQLGQTVYGGAVDATAGTLTVTMANIASYDGETLPGKWISDRDVYAPDTTPTTGAQVVYELAEPVVVELTPQQLETLIGTNNVWSDGGNVSLTYTKYNYTEGY